MRPPRRLFTKQKWPLAGPFPSRSLGLLCVVASIVVVTVLVDHHPDVMAAPAVVAVFAKFGARAVAMMIAVSGHDSFSACDRRCCDSDRTKCCNNVSELLHVVLLIVRNKLTIGCNVPAKSEESSEQPFRIDDIGASATMARYSMIA